MEVVQPHSFRPFLSLAFGCSAEHQSNHLERKRQGNPVVKQLLYEIRDEKALEDALAEVKAAVADSNPQSVLLHFYCGDFFDGDESRCAAFTSLILERTNAVLPEAPIVGMSSGGEIRRAHLVGACVLMSAILFQSSWVKVMPFKDILSAEREAGEWLLATTELFEDVQGVELLFAGSEIDSAPIYESLRECRDGLPFFGGYAVERNTAREPAFLLTREGVLHNAMVAVLYGGDELHFDAGRTTGWKPLGSTFRVTEAQGRRLISVNGIPAYNLYDRFLKFPDEESFRDYAMEFPLMLMRGKMRLLRHPRKKLEDSSIMLDGRVNVGDVVCLSYGAPLDIIRKMNKRCEKIRDFEPEAVLLFSCQGRLRYWGDLIDWEMEPFQKVAETGGACLDGQIMRNSQTGRVLEHRLTLLSVAMREGEKTGRSIPDIAVDDTVLISRMSLVHRMSTLIESMIDELQKTNDALLGMNERLARANDELHRIAITDELTGLYNRREIERRIKAALEKSRTDKKKISLVMLDIDFFKKVNDCYGHDVGDLVLKDVSAILQDCTDESLGEAVGRWGGEEFFILLPDKPLEKALELAEMIRSVVERHDFPEAKHLTVSMGVTNANAESNYQAIFIQADQALYQAKQDGRNRVVCIADGS